jgi:hypothetical protein
MGEEVELARVEVDVMGLAEKEEVVEKVFEN